MPLSLQYRLLTPAAVDVLINVVDTADGALVDAWAVSLSCTVPAPTKEFDQTVSRSKGERRRIALNNPYTVPVTFRLCTDKPSLLRFRPETVQIAAGQTEKVGLQFQPLRDEELSAATVMVFVTDESDKVDECFAIRVRYV